MCLEEMQDHILLSPHNSASLVATRPHQLSEAMLPILDGERRNPHAHHQHIAMWPREPHVPPLGIPLISALLPRCHLPPPALATSARVHHI
jgi:hypothetical protein